MLLDQKAYPHLVYQAAREMLQHELQNLELGYERSPYKENTCGNGGHPWVLWTCHQVPSMDPFWTPFLGSDVGYSTLGSLPPSGVSTDK